MRILVIIVASTLLFLSSVAVKAQTGSQGSEQVKVVFKNGASVEGQWVDMQPGIQYRLLANQGDTIVIPHEVIRRVISRESQASEPDYKYLFREEGLYHASAIGLLMNTVSRNNGGLTGIELSASLGWQFNRLIGVGLGSGVDFYHLQGEEILVPVFIEARGYLLRQPVTPYYVFRTGYGFGVANERVGIRSAGGGWMINPAIGWRLSARKGMDLTIDLGLKFQPATFEWRQGAERSNAELYYKRLNITIGFLF